MPEKNRVGAPLKYDKKLDTRITILVPEEFKQKYFSVIPGGNASEHILSVLRADYEKLSGKK